MDGYLREKKSRLQMAYGMMALKSGICAAPFLLLAMIIAILWLADFAIAPHTWQEAEVRYSRMGEVKYISVRGSRGASPALMTTDGGAYACWDADAELLAGSLQGGEHCRIVYSNRLDGYAHLEALTVDGEALVDRAAHEQHWHDMHRQTGMAALLFASLAAAAASLGYALWGRRGWEDVHRLRREIAVREAKNAARQAKKAVCKGG